MPHNRQPARTGVTHLSGRVLVLGASGMLGSAAFRVFDEAPGWDAYGTLRSGGARQFFPTTSHERLLIGVDIDSSDALTRAFAAVRPQLVVNCVGVIKQLQSAKDPLATIPINSLLPHRVALLCEAVGARMIHVSTDCVFTGRKGDYLESDAPDADDLYGRSKLLGEVDYPHAITLRTSIIGEELGGGANGLVGWFLAQSGQVKGFRRAVFSGFPTVVLATIMKDVVAPREDLRGVYHVSADAIDKFSLLQLVKQAYGKSIEITPDDALVIDRSLNSDRFRKATGYRPPTWPTLIREMHAFTVGH